MTDEEFMPDWTHKQVAISKQKIANFAARLGELEKESDDQRRADLLGNVLGLLGELDDFSRRFSFFVKIAGLTDAKETLNTDAAKLCESGFPVKANLCPKLVNVLFLDTETTGLSANDQPISIGLVLAEVDAATGLIVSEVTLYYGLREPSCEIGLGAFRVHGISKTQLSGKDFDYSQLVSMFGVAEIVVAHNAKFDKSMLRFMHKYSRMWGCSCWDIEWPNTAGGRSLDALCNYFKINRPLPHNSLSDTRAMIEIVQQQEKNGITYLKSLLLKHGLST